jgi:hypothetical protein
MLSESAVAPAGILLVQSVLGRWASTVTVLAGPSGSLFGPTVFRSRRVSTRLQVSIGTRAGQLPLNTSANANCCVPAPITVPAVREGEVRW